MHVEPHKDRIEPDQYPLDLIHSNISGPYIWICSGPKYFVNFFDNYDKISEVIILSSKDRVLAAFDLLCKRNKYGNNCIWCLQTDRGGEYDSHAFEDYRNKHEI